MITNSEEANKYYQVINQFIDEYTEKHKIKPSSLGKYLKNNAKLSKFMERKGLKDIKNVDRVIKDVIDDRISLEKDTVITFENFKFFESNEYKVINLRQCLYKGIDGSNIHHEKILADHFDVSLSHINVVDSNKHIFKIESIQKDLECIIYTKEELEIIRENMKEHCLDQVFNKKIKLEGIGINLDVSVKDFIDKEKFTNHIDDILTINEVNEIISVLLSCENIEQGDNTQSAFIGINPEQY